MAKSCERCKLIRIQLTILFGVFIIVNFLVHRLLNIKIENTLDVLLFPSCGVIILGIINLLFMKKKTK